MRTLQWFDPSGHLNDDGVHLYVDALKLNRRGDLPEGLRSHVAECASCKKQVLDLHAAIRDVPYPAGDPHPFFDRVEAQSGPAFFTFWRIAAAIALLLGVSAVAAYLLTVRHPGAMLTTERPAPQSDTAAAVIGGADLFAANFTVSPSLQRYVGQSFRSEGVEILSPAVGEVMRDSLVFAWKGVVDPPVVVRIVNNREDQVFQSTVRGSRWALRRLFAPGLYYWKLESKDELLYVGSFLVDRGEVSRR